MTEENLSQKVRHQKLRTIQQNFHLTNVLCHLLAKKDTKNRVQSGNFFQSVEKGGGKKNNNNKKKYAQELSMTTNLIEIALNK